MRASGLLAAAAVAAIAGAARAAAPAGLDGTWTLDVARSDYGDFPGPGAETLSLRSTGDRVRLEVASTVRRSTRRYMLDLPLGGSETHYSLSDDIRIGTAILRSASAAWRGDRLVITETVQHMQEMTVLETIYALSPDGRSLSLQTVPKGEAVQSTLVFERRDAKP